MLFRILFFVGISIELFGSMALAMGGKKMGGKTKGGKKKCDDVKVTNEQLTEDINSLFDTLSSIAVVQPAELDSEWESECFWRVTGEFSAHLYRSQIGKLDGDIIKFSIHDVASSSDFLTDILFTLLNNDGAQLQALFLSCPGFPNKMDLFSAMLNIKTSAVQKIMRNWSTEYSISTGQLTFRIAGMQPRVILDPVKILNNLMESQPAYFEAGVWKTGIKRDNQGNIRYPPDLGITKENIPFSLIMMHQNSESLTVINCPQCHQQEGPACAVQGVALTLFRDVTLAYRPKKSYKNTPLDFPLPHEPLQRRKETELREWTKSHDFSGLSPEQLQLIRGAERICWVFKANHTGSVYILMKTVSKFDFHASELIPQKLITWRRVCESRKKLYILDRKGRKISKHILLS